MSMALGEHEHHVPIVGSLEAGVGHSVCEFAVDAGIQFLNQGLMDRRLRPCRVKRPFGCSLRLHSMDLLNINLVPEGIARAGLHESYT